MSQPIIPGFRAVYLIQWTAKYPWSIAIPEPDPRLLTFYHLTKQGPPTVVPHISTNVEDQTRQIAAVVLLGYVPESRVRELHDTLRMMRADRTNSAKRLNPTVVWTPESWVAMCVDYLFTSSYPFLSMPTYESDLVFSTPEAFRQSPYSLREDNYWGIASRISVLLALSLPKLKLGNNPWYKAVQYSVFPRPTW